MTEAETLDVVVVGAGPTGLSCAIECTRRELRTVVIEKGCLTNSIYHFPANMIFFTTADLLEIGDVPFSTGQPKPTREEGLNYYKRVVQYYRLHVRTYERVTAIRREKAGFTVTTSDAHGRPLRYGARFAILATGYYDHPNRLGIPGEDLPKVSHYYTDPHPYFDKDVLIIGGKNSACIAALELHRYGARVTVVHRRAEIRESVKYWVLPDFLHRVRDQVIALLLESTVTEISETTVTVHHTPSGERKILPNDFVFALTGYHPDTQFLESCGVRVDPATLVPEHDPDTLETNVPGLFVAGSISAGKNTNRLFIENGRFHGRVIAERMLRSV